MEVIDETRRTRTILGVLNSTHITLILKKDKSTYFHDYRPIALFNLLYKIISKIITARLKLYLDNFISENQFGFLTDRHLQDAVGST